MTGVALTFDDGPDPVWTPRLLDELARADAVATFFVLGPAVAVHPDLVRRCVAEGHAVGVHGWDHLRHPSSPRTRVAADLDKALDALEAVDVHPVWWRLPWGLPAPWTAPLAGSRELRLAGWTADAHDWRGDDAGTMLDRLRPRLGPDAVVLAHDGVGPGARRADAAETVALVEPLVRAMRDGGQAPVVLDELGAVPTGRGGSAG